MPLSPYSILLVLQAGRCFPRETETRQGPHSSAAYSTLLPPCNTTTATGEVPESMIGRVMGDGVCGGMRGGREAGNLPVV